MPENQKCSVLALLGAPNAGKSTLLNRLVGQKVSIVTPKVQTTRIKVKGIVVENDTQLVFIDTPGIFAPEKRLHKAMVKEAWSSINNADEVLLLVDSTKGIQEETEVILTKLMQSGVSPILILNKVDKIKKEMLLPLTEELSKKGEFKHIFMISALDGEGVKGLTQHLVAEAGESPWLYPEDQVSDLPLRILAAEETREQLFMSLQQELPYGITVETEKWDETDDKITIHQVVYVARKNHKNIIIGKGGSAIKKVGEKTRKILERMLEKKVNLFLFVKHKENWEDDRDIYQAMGLEYPQ